MSAKDSTIMALVNTLENGKNKKKSNKKKNKEKSNKDKSDSKDSSKEEAKPELTSMTLKSQIGRR
jgi:hypothetical protein